jgi:4-amino-4-deoxy-L-arabinose transferase-like glycosyltransferase
VVAWLILHLGCLFTPGLLDDVDSIYTEVAREMLLRHDYVTPYIDGIRFFDKPPLMYWLAAAGMKLFGAYDWAARLPLSLLILGFFFSVYALGKRFFGERGGLYSALVMATSLGPYLFTRFYIPDILNAFWMTLGIHLFLIALDRVKKQNSARLPAWGFAMVMALNLLTKGLIGVVFPIGFVVFYLVLTRQFRILLRLNLISGAFLFALMALPWHVLAALRNPAINADARGWFWFYVVNEHLMRFLGKRIPHDYGQVPLLFFWLIYFLMLLPWTAFLPAALARYVALSRRRPMSLGVERLGNEESQPAQVLLIWTAIILGFFSFSSRQEYYSLPAVPALALIVGGILVAAESDNQVRRNILRGAKWVLLPLCTISALVCGYFAITAPTPSVGADLSLLLHFKNTTDYTLSLNHLYDLTGVAMGYFRGPLVGVAVAMLGAGPLSWILRRRNYLFASNLTLAASMIGVLLCAHEGLARYYPILGSKSLALAIQRDLQPGDRIMIDGELASGSSLLFYTRQPVSLVNGRINGPWYGSFWPNSPHIFETDDSLHRAWAGTERVFLLTYDPQKRVPDLSHFGSVHTFATSGGKTILTNR